MSDWKKVLIDTYPEQIEKFKQFSSWFLLIAISVTLLGFVSACSEPSNEDRILARAREAAPVRLCGDSSWVYRDPLTKRLTTYHKLFDERITDPEKVCS